MQYCLIAWIYEEGFKHLNVSLIDWLVHFAQSRVQGAAVPKFKTEVKMISIAFLVLKIKLIYLAKMLLNKDLITHLYIKRFSLQIYKMCLKTFRYGKIYLK